MNKKTLYTVLVSAALSMGLSSCSDWLDVRGENIEKEQDMYAKYKGFTAALVGAYMDMASTSIYGQDLTMTVSEELANLWEDNSNKENYPLRYECTHHEYDGDKIKSEMKSIYGKLFNVITSANVIIKNAEANPGSFPSEKAKAVVLGEAYAMRAYCQLDVLRLFGQMPQNAQKKVRLPYSETSAIEDIPAYYDYADYVAKLKSDIEKAESLLKDNDPIFDYTFAQLNISNTVDDDSWHYRQSRLNYWAVRALKARMLMYVGEKAEAAKVAREIIAAKDKNGNAVIELSGASDLAKGYNGLPSECLFYLSKFDVNKYSTNRLIGVSSEVVSLTGAYFINIDQLNALYESLPNANASHNRYLNMWYRNARDNYNRTIATCKKYFFDESGMNGAVSANNSNLVTKVQIIPMLRLSEMYLIAIEGAANVAEANSYYDTYMQECAMPIHPEFQNMDEVKAEMINEYRREFIAEGQMFYTYKRNAVKNVLWNKAEMGEAQYIIPLPSTEYDPSNHVK